MKQEQGEEMQVDEGISEKIKVVALKKGRRMNKQIKSPTRTRQPLKELNGQCHRPEHQWKQKVSLRNEEMRDAEMEDQDQKRNRIIKMSVCDAGEEVGVEASPTWSPKSA